MNTANALQKKFLSFHEASLWAEAKAKSGKWDRPTIQRIVENASPTATRAVYLVTLRNPAPVTCPYTGRVIGKTVSA